MKIGPTHTISSKFHQPPPVAETKGPEGDFNSHLRHTLRATESLGGSSLPAEGIITSAPVAALQPFPMPTRNRLVARLDSLLDDLSLFHARLKAPELETEAVDPLIEKLAIAREQLMGAVGSLPDDDALKTLLNQALMLTSTELIKFRRGDYD